MYLQVFDPIFCHYQMVTKGTRMKGKPLESDSKVESHSAAFFNNPICLECLG